MNHLQKPGAEYDRESDDGYDDETTTNSHNIDIDAELDGDEREPPGSKRKTAPREDEEDEEYEPKRHASKIRAPRKRFTKDECRTIWEIGFQTHKKYARGAVNRWNRLEKEARQNPALFHFDVTAKTLGARFSYMTTKKNLLRFTRLFGKKPKKRLFVTSLI